MAEVDVLVQNFSPGAIDRLGFSWETVSALNPRLIMCSISAFGSDGPLRDKPGYDAVAQAYDGVPVAPVLSVSDAMSHPHMQQTGIVRWVTDDRIGDFQIPGVPIRFSEFPDDLVLESSDLGEDNRAEPAPGPSRRGRTHGGGGHDRRAVGSRVAGPTRLAFGVSAGRGRCVAGCRRGHRCAGRIP